MTRLAFSLLMAATLLGAERTVDPTFLHRYVPDLAVKPADVSTPTCHYKPIFGEGDSVTSIVKGIARYGEMIVEPKGACALASYPAEEQVYVILEGSGVLSYGAEKVPVRRNDFMYLPAGIRHGISNPADMPCRVIVMGFRIPGGKPGPARKLLRANIDEVGKQTVQGHPPSVLYQLLMGDTKSTRDKIAAGQRLTSLFIMEFAPGGTNFPHHHETEEEIYLVLGGHGEMVAGGGMDGIEGRHPAKAGDAYFFRLNCTVGFYNSNDPGAKTRILAVRSLFPGPL
jgi:mannose-6-phosphate isomerase-like protein (cupin superfamily)